MQLHLVKSDDALCEDADRSGSVEADPTLLHGIKVPKELVVPWFFSERLVVGDTFILCFGGLCKGAVALSAPFHWRCQDCEPHVP
jgi:hypothetical protein